jgi:hypothetical protein
LLGFAPKIGIFGKQLAKGGINRKFRAGKRAGAEGKEKTKAKSLGFFFKSGRLDKCRTFL